LVGIPVGLFFALFSFGFGHEPSLLKGWLIGSVLALVFFLPHWWEIRRGRRGKNFLTVPPWVLWTGVSILMLSTAILVRFGD
jgi:hypothetical protein